MEIVGLLLIVIIVVVVFFFMISFNISEAETRQNTAIEFTDTHISSNLGIALVNTHTNCTDPNNNKLTIANLIDLCTRGTPLQCDELTVCEHLNKTLELALNETLKEWGYTYQLTITTPNNNMLTNITRQCPQNARNSITNTIPISTRDGPVSFRIRYCTQ